MNIASKTVAITVGIICILLAASLAGTIIHYTSIVNAKDDTITTQTSTINNLNSTIKNLNQQIDQNNEVISSQNATIKTQETKIQNLTDQNRQLQTWLEGNITTLNAQIANLTAQIVTLQSQASASDAQIASLEEQLSSAKSTMDSLKSQLQNAYEQVAEANGEAETRQNQVNKLESIINLENSNLQTLAFHVCMKDWVQVPNVTDTYNQLLALNNGAYKVLLFPEYYEHQNWTEEFAWLNASFGGPQGIPIMLDVFASSEGAASATRLSLENISSAVAACNVQYLRFAEVVSWCQEHNETFPASYVTSVLDFCKANQLKVFWTEWKPEAFETIQEYLTDYGDMLAVSFSTNSESLKPGSGCLDLSDFQHWGASVQSWYWSTHTNQSEWDMPASLLVEHALTAKNVGSEIIEFEPYWYFFTNGQPNENLKLLWAMLT